MNPSKEWSQIHLHLRQMIGPQVVPSLRPLIYNGATQLIKTLVDFEGNPVAKIEMYGFPDSHCGSGVLIDPQFSGVGTIINRMAYGDEIFNENGQKILEMNHQGVNSMAFIASRFWFVDVFPLCMHTFLSMMLYTSLRFSVQYIPSWFPGATFQQVAKKSRIVSDYIRYEPWRLLLDRVRSSL